MWEEGQVFEWPEPTSWTCGGFPFTLPDMSPGAFRYTWSNANWRRIRWGNIMRRKLARLR